MPIHITVDSVAQRRISVLTGVIADRDLIEAYTALLASPEYDPTLDDLVDACGVVRVEVTPDGVRDVARVVASMDALNPGTRIALVAPGGAAYVMARLFTYYREAQGAPAEHRVFRDVDDAHAWLTGAR